MKIALKFLVVPMAALFATGADAAAPAVKNNYAATQKNSTAQQSKTSSEGMYAGFSVLKGLSSWKNRYSIDTYDTINDMYDTVYDDEELKYWPFGLSGAIGLYNHVLRGELEFNYMFPYSDRYINAENDTYHTLDKGNYSFMLNGYFDFGTRQWAVRPYIGLGVGVNITDIEMALKTSTIEGTYQYNSLMKKETRTSSRLSGQGMLGAYGEVGNGVYLDFGYKFVMSGNSSMENDITYKKIELPAETLVSEKTGTVKTDFTSEISHLLRLGIRFEI